MGNPRYSNGYRRRRERERWRHMRADCYICHRPIDYELKAPHPYSFVVDETIALARGGTLTHDNSGPAHRWCNAIKGTHSLAWARERVAQLIAQGKAPLAHKTMLFVSKVLAATAVELMADPALLEQARGVDPTRPRRGDHGQSAVFPPGFFPHSNGGRLGVQNVENPSLEERVEVP